MWSGSALTPHTPYYEGKTYIEWKKRNKKALLLAQLDWFFVYSGNGSCQYAAQLRHHVLKCTHTFEYKNSLCAITVCVHRHPTT